MCLPVSNGSVIQRTVCTIQLILPRFRGKLLGSGFVQKFTTCIFRTFTLKSLFLDLSSVYVQHLYVIRNPSARRRNWFCVTQINLICRLESLVLASRDHVVDELMVWLSSRIKETCVVPLTEDGGIVFHRPLRITQTVTPVTYTSRCAVRISTTDLPIPTEVFRRSLLTVVTDIGIVPHIRPRPVPLQFIIYSSRNYYMLYILNY